MVDRVLKKYAQHTAVELAVKLGVDDTYVSKLRGGWRPTRVGAGVWERLVALDPARPAVDERQTGSIPEGMDPVTWAAAQLSLLSRMAGDASATLVHYRRGRDITVEEMAAGEATIARSPQVSGAIQPPGRTGS